VSAAPIKALLMTSLDEPATAIKVVRAEEYDELQAENAALRAVLREYVKTCRCLHAESLALQDRARALLGEK
jgi:hypothetical protein